MCKCTGGCDEQTEVCSNGFCCPIGKVYKGADAGGCVCEEGEPEDGCVSLTVWSEEVCACICPDSSAVEDEKAKCASECKEWDEEMCMCKTESTCTSEQECCGGKCITKCDTEQCEACNEEQQACEKMYSDPDTQGCCKGEVYAKATHECCKDEVKEVCSNGQTRNSETCECECSSSEQCAEGQECCGKQCITKCDTNECQICDGSGSCKNNYDNKTQECCKGEILSKCEGGKQRNRETCECECPEGKVECDGECKVIPTPKPCEKLSDDKCSTVSLCGEGEQCCGGQCITACNATNCEKCDSSSSSCVKDEANCGDCKDEWSGNGEKWDETAQMKVSCPLSQTRTFNCLGTCYTVGKYEESIDYNGCSGLAEKTDRECCAEGKVVCGPSDAQVCCDACNANNTGCCEASKTCGTNCCEQGCLSDNVTCAECRADSDCANGGTCCDGKCCANACSSDGKSCAQCDEDSDCASDCMKCNMNTRTCETKCDEAAGLYCLNDECVALPTGCGYALSECRRLYGACAGLTSDSPNKVCDNCCKNIDEGVMKDCYVDEGCSGSHYYCDANMIYLSEEGNLETINALTWGHYCVE